KEQTKKKGEPRLFLDGWIVFVSLLVLAIYFLFFKGAYGFGIATACLALLLPERGWEVLPYPKRAAVYTLGMITGVADSGPVLRIPGLQKLQRFSAERITYSGDRIPKQDMSTSTMTIIAGKIFAAVEPGNTVEEVRHMYLLPLTADGDVDSIKRDEIFLDIIAEKVRAVVGQHKPEDLVQEHDKLVSSMREILNNELSSRYGHHCVEVGISDYDELVRSEEARRIAMARAKGEEARILGDQVRQNPELAKIMIASTYAAAATSAVEGIARAFSGSSSKNRPQKKEEKEGKEDESILEGVAEGLKRIAPRRKGGRQ
ncbi:MAG: SPFH domain-containing protein, partial [Patescibacteria group bacterium]